MMELRTRQQRVNDGKLYMCCVCSVTMATEGEPTDLIKVLHLLVLSFSWGMQVWVSFIAGKTRVTHSMYSHHSHSSAIFDL